MPPKPQRVPLMQDNTLTLTAKTFAGLEDVLAKELTNLGAADVRPGKRAVMFTGDHDMMMKVNLWSRTALSVLRQINAFHFTDKDSFFSQMLETDWSAYFDAGKTFAVHAVASRSELFTNTMFLGQLTKDAIVDHFRDKTGRRPNVDAHQPEVKINVYVNELYCVVSLDSSGDALFRRGYRRDGGMAPLNEILAAGLILMSGWDGRSTFIDPMCGSGTFSVEAALLGANVAPGIMRKAFSFMHWRGYDPDRFERMCEEARQQQQPLKAHIIASDINIKGLDTARQNLMETGFLGQVRVQRNDFFHFHPPAENGWVMLNPPYGHRLKQDDLPAFYKMIGDTLKQHYAGYYAGIISQEVNRLKHVGLKPRKRFRVYNGPLECQFAVFELFQGSHKEFVTTARPRRPRL
jgi:putative N6-adenine-specific DNA methylase